MKKQTEIFNLLYQHLAENGREQMLLGDNAAILYETFEKMLVSDFFPETYLEVPLLGTPGCDLVSIHHRHKNAKCSPGTGFGYRAVVDWYNGLADTDGLCYGFGADLSSNKGDHNTGIYLQCKNHMDLLSSFLDLLGESSRLHGYQEICSRMPEDWKLYYVSLFSGRAGSPGRLTVLTNRKKLLSYTKDPALLGKDLDQVGFTAYDSNMLKQLTDYLRIIPKTELQFDLAPDGKLLDSFGMCFFLGSEEYKYYQENRTFGNGAVLAEKLQRDGIADERWKLAADASYLTVLPMRFPKEEMNVYSFFTGVHDYKVKFKAAKALPAKCYFDLGLHYLGNMDDIISDKQ